MSDTSTRRRRPGVPVTTVAALIAGLVGGGGVAGGIGVAVRPASSEQHTALADRVVKLESAVAVNAVAISDLRTESAATAATLRSILDTLGEIKTDVKGLAQRRR